MEDFLTELPKNFKSWTDFYFTLKKENLLGEKFVILNLSTVAGRFTGKFYTDLIIRNSIDELSIHIFNPTDLHFIEHVFYQSGRHNDPNSIEFIYKLKKAII